MAPGEAQWLTEDTDYALAWQAEKRVTCEGCGHPLDESTDSEHVRDYQAAELTCHACAVIDWRRQALSEQEVDMGGVRIYATRK